MTEFDQMQIDLAQKANKNEVMSKQEITDQYDRQQKVINDNSRRIIEIENKMRTVENE